MDLRPDERIECVRCARPTRTEMVKLYATLEKFAKSLGPVEFVTRERYVLLRSHRIFADAVIMSDRKRVTHVARLRAVAELESMKPFLREAYDYSVFLNVARAGASV